MKRDKAKGLIGILILLCGVSLVFCIQSCDKDGAEAVKEDQGSPLEICDVTISGVQTKAADSFSNGIGIFRMTADGYNGERKNVKYVNSGSGWGAAAGQKTVYLTKRSVMLSAYYPYDADCGDGVKTISSCLSTEAADLCYAHGVSAKEGTPVTFNLNHAYAKVKFVFTRAEAYSGNCAVSGIGISDSNGKMIRSARLDMNGGKVSGQTYGSVGVNPGIGGISAGSSVTAEVLMVPTTGLGTMTLDFTVDGSLKSSTVTSIGELVGGSSYTINVQIREEKVETAANCHIVAPLRSITFPVNVRGNGGAVAGTGLSTSISPASVGIVWETAANLITLGDLSDGKVKISAGSTAGNAVIAAYSGANQTGVILWSWHIWVTDYDPDTPSNGTTYTITNTASASYTFMDRNLGATSATAGDVRTIGLHYQWGRKDPFTASSSFSSNDEMTVYDGSGSIFTFVGKAQTVSVDNNLENSINNPKVFYLGAYGISIGYDWYTATNSHSYQNQALWGGASTSAPSDKTIFDPCPAGWRVPAWSGSQSPWSRISNGASISTVGTFSNYGVIWSVITAGCWPAAGYRDGGGSSRLFSVCANGYYWSASASSAVVKSTYCFSFSSSKVGGVGYDHRANGFSVRCVKE